MRNKMMKMGMVAAALAAFSTGAIAQHEEHHPGGQVTESQTTQPKAQTMRFGCGAHMVHGHGGHDHEGHGTGDRAGSARDPVCGMPVAAGQGYSEIYQGRELHFCSRACLDKFDAQPQRYAA